MLVLVREAAVLAAVRRALEGWELTMVDNDREMVRHVRKHPVAIIVAECSSLSRLIPIRRVSLITGVPSIVIGTDTAEQRHFGAACLEAGADDYVEWPFDEAEFRARAEKRAQRNTNTSVAGLRIDTSERRVMVDDEDVELTNKEYELLVFLMANANRPHSRDQLLQAVWGSSSDWQSPETVTEHVHRLRRKLEQDPARPELLVTVRGVGYCFKEPDGSPETLVSN